MPGIRFSHPLEDDPKSVNRVWKSGRSTGLTSSDCNSLAQARITRERGPDGETVMNVTHEHMVSTARDAFGQPGGSGSFIFDQHVLACFSLALS